ncbi:HlyD family secretion protein [Polystyrenella longa]|uniref:HlyD family secretion protein n=1 Tax=Polystyrenella longa TaxID=2528007 RepID=A0A518CS98_9PLAN|nr:HlyD family efflux transporter periplasmic adaptor subunit [Polystyrenella longa]QDU82107.1 HlyD family secretion protein [Polystyrenella longa]
MSSPENVEKKEAADDLHKARNLIKQLAQEIEELVRSPIEPPDFFREFLKRVVQALHAPAGAVWLLDANKQLQLVSDLNLRGIGFYDHPGSLQKNHQLVIQTISTGEAVIHRPGNPETPLPTDHIVILASLQRDGECVGVVEIFQRSDASMGSHSGMLQFVEHLAGLASKFLSKEAVQEQTSVGPIQENYDKFLNDLHRSLDLKQVTATAANDSRRLMNCDRVTLCVKRGRKVTVEAISGQDKVNHRANLVSSLRKLSETVMESREPFAFYGKADDLPPQLEKLLTTYLQESESRMLLILPLLKPDKLVRDEDEIAGKIQKKDKLQPLIGCLVIEQINESEPRAGVKQYADLLEEHVAIALNNSLDHKRIFLLPVWNFIGGIQEWFKGRKLAKTLAIGSAIIAVGCALAFIPWDYRVEGEGRLMPIERRTIFATANAEVEQVLINGGEHVKKGQILIELRDKELDLTYQKTRKELDSKSVEWTSLETEMGQLNRSGLSNAEQSKKQIELSGQIRSAETVITGLNEQIKMLQESREKLHVRSPIDGVISTWQVEQLLLHRPVNWGESLLEVINENGPWHLEIEVEEDRYGHLVQAQKELNTETLPVEFILATTPESTYEGEVQEIATRANTSSENTNILQVNIKIDESALPTVRMGSEVRVKINCGKKSLGYVLFGDVVEFLRKYLWL